MKTSLITMIASIAIVSIINNIESFYRILIRLSPSAPTHSCIVSVDSFGQSGRGASFSPLHKFIKWVCRDRTQNHFFWESALNIS